MSLKIRVQSEPVTKLGKNVQGFCNEGSMPRVSLFCSCYCKILCVNSTQQRGQGAVSKFPSFPCDEQLQKASKL